MEKETPLMERVHLKEDAVKKKEIASMFEQEKIKQIRSRDQSERDRTVYEKTDITCLTCIHWVEVPQQMIVGQVKNGLCKRFPPTPYPVQNTQGIGVMMLRASVNENDLCGEYDNGED